MHLRITVFWMLLYVVRLAQYNNLEEQTPYLKMFESLTPHISAFGAQRHNQMCYVTSIYLTEFEMRYMRVTQIHVTTYSKPK